MPDSDTNATVPDMDHSAESASQDDLLANILSDSPIMNFDESLPDGDDVETDESTDEDLESEDEDATENEDEEGDDESANEDEESEDDDESTQDDDEASEEGEIDMEFEIPVKIDGEESNVTIEELVKGYSTQQHLSKQGRELGEQRKALETERTEKLKEVSDMAAALTETLMTEENGHAATYAGLKGELADLRKAGDKFAIADKKDELEVAQEAYWNSRKAREKTEADVKKQTEEAKTKEWNEEIKVFNDTIKDFIPDFDKKVAIEVREFAIEKGIPEKFIDTVSDPLLVKFIDDYRRLVVASSKGSAKRKAAPKKKIAPTKKATPPKVKEERNKKALSSKIKEGTFSEEEGMDFLRSRASKHFK